MILTSRPATASEIEAYYGHPPQVTMRAILFYLDGKLAGIGGVKREEGNMICFSEIREEFDPPKLTIWRAAKMVVDQVVKTTKAPVFAVSTPEIEGSDAFIQRLKFEHHQSSPSGEIYKYVGI